MTDRISISQLYMTPIKPAGAKPTVPNGQSPHVQQNGATFREILQSKVLKFSNHAETRLKQRGIHLQQDQLMKLETAVNKAAAKGAKESLVLMNEVAFIVNIPNRTVVTAMDGQSMRDNVFTQIDSAVIVS